MDDPKSIPSDRALSDMGLDSLASLELGNNLEESLNIPIPSTLVYDYPTLANMVDYFLGLLGPTEAASDAQSGQLEADTPVPSEQLPAEDEIRGAGENRATGTAAGGAIDTTEILHGLQKLSEELNRWGDV